MNKNLVAIGALMLSACTTASTVMLDDRTAMIDAHGTGWNSGSDVIKKVLRTAAEQARAKGYEYFTIVSSADDSSSGVAYIPGQATTNTYGNAYCSGNYCSGSATSTTYGEAPHYVPFTRPGANVVIHFLKEDELPENRSGIYQASAILASK